MVFDWFSPWPKFSDRVRKIERDSLERERDSLIRQNSQLKEKLQNQEEDDNNK
jgi:hypothetical protein